MAKAKKRKSRRVGALSPGSMVTKLAAVAAGYFLVAKPLNDALEDVFKKKDEKPPATTSGFGDNMDVQGVVTAGAGAALLFLGGKSSMIKTIAGGVLLGAGVKKLMDSGKDDKKEGVTGYQSVPVIGNRRRMAGYQQTPVIGAVPGQLQGVPAQLQGYRVNGYQPNGSGVMGAVGSADLRDAAGAGIAVGSSAGYMR